MGLSFWPPRWRARNLSKMTHPELRRPSGTQMLEVRPSNRVFEIQRKRLFGLVKIRTWKIERLTLCSHLQCAMKWRSGASVRPLLIQEKAACGRIIVLESLDRCSMMRGFLNFKNFWFNLHWSNSLILGVATSANKLKTFLVDLRLWVALSPTLSPGRPFFPIF